MKLTEGQEVFLTKEVHDAYDKLKVHERAEIQEAGNGVVEAALVYLRSKHDEMPTHMRTITLHVAAASFLAAANRVS